jgi:hypothetical protein
VDFACRVALRRAFGGPFGGKNGHKGRALANGFFVRYYEIKKGYVYKKKSRIADRQKREREYK